MLSGAKEICQADIPIGIRAFGVMILALFAALQAKALRKVQYFLRDRFRPALLFQKISREEIE
jgi:hypothetical protein